MIRVLVTRPETWEATFTVGLEGLLNPRDRLALPGAAERVLWIGGDATLEVAAATDWGAKVYITFLVEPYLAALRNFTGTPGDDATIISVADSLVAQPSGGAIRTAAGTGGSSSMSRTTTISESGWVLATLGTVWPGTSCASSAIWR